MNEAPTQEQIDASPALQALQALKYEDDNPDGNPDIFLYNWKYTIIQLKNPVS